VDEFARANVARVGGGGEDARRCGQGGGRGRRLASRNRRAPVYAQAHDLLPGFDAGPAVVRTDEGDAAFTANEGAAGAADRGLVRHHAKEILLGVDVDAAALEAQGEEHGLLDRDLGGVADRHLRPRKLDARGPAAFGAQPVADRERLLFGHLRPRAALALHLDFTEHEEHARHFDHRRRRGGLSRGLDLRERGGDEKRREEDGDWERGDAAVHF
jgi:hypothetical protein